MSVTPIRHLERPKARHEQRAGRVYAIAFDLSQGAAQWHFGPGDSWKGCYEKIGRVLTDHGFTRQQGSVYFGSANTRATDCFAAVMELDRFPWFLQVCRDMRMLRIDENDDLLSVLPSRLRFDVERVA